MSATGDTQVDDHHTVEDVGIVLGQAVRQALGDKHGIGRFSDVCIAMDEALVQAAIDISGRGAAYVDLPLPTQKVGTFDCELGEEFFCGLARDAGIRFTCASLRAGTRTTSSRPRSSRWAAPCALPWSSTAASPAFPRRRGRCDGTIPA